MTPDLKADLVSVCAVLEGAIFYLERIAEIEDIKPSLKLNGLHPAGEMVERYRKELQAARAAAAAM